jgi:hypothetical protein
MYREKEVSSVYEKLSVMDFEEKATQKNSH